MKFLGNIAKAFYEREREEISKICFVFPGRRASLFFQRELSALIDKPLFSPSLITISDLFSELSGLRNADKLDCVYRLYRLYCDINENPEPFDDFVYWGETLLSDFDDTDKFLADPYRLFANIKELKELDTDYSFLSERQLNSIKSFWASFHNGEESDKKSKFKSLWSLMLPLYTNLRVSLESDGAGYEGMIYRKIAEQISNGDTVNVDSLLSKYSYVVFIGFNALNKCEKTLLNYIKLSGKADFYWDYCGTMVNDPDNKSSFFINENLSSYPSSMDIDFNEERIAEIELIGVPSAVGQAKIAGDILSSLPTGINSAVILPDESLLTSVIRSLDYNKGEINITMGYPLREASVVSFAESLVELQGGPFYFRRVLPVLRHNYVKGITGELSVSLENKIVTANMLYVSQDLFTGNHLLEMIFRRVIKDDDSNVDKISKISTYILDVLDYIVKNKQVNKFEKELIYYFYTLVVRIKDLQIPMSVKTYLRLLKQLVNSTSVPFKGEPLAGLQVMGVLEARCLDFDNIVICSMNEGVFPSRNLSTSFIPLNLRKGFSLPENEYADAVSAYSFYRTIYRAKRVWMLYDTRSEGLSSGEQSRFILQLRYHYKIPLRDMVSSGVVTRNQKSPIIIEKKGVVAQELEKFRSGTKFFSASLLSTYILCPLKFYFMHIEGVKDEEIVSESVESRTFGTILHNSMAILYRRFEGKDVCKKDLLAILNNQSLIDDIIYKEFKKEKGVEDVKGYNYIICNLIQRYIIKIIKYDLGFNSFRYIQSEKDIRSSLKLRDGTEVKLKAYIDRIDRVNGKLRIIDYKTGRKPDTMKSLNQLFEQNSSKNLSVFFQLYLYGLMLSPEGESLLLPYFLRELDQKYQINCTVEDLNSFRELLSSKISEILNIEMPFIQTASQKSCEYCIFKQICR